MNGAREKMNWDLIAAYLDGNLSDKERLEVENWIEASDDNKKQFEEAKKIWSATENGISQYNYDTESAWGKMQGLMDEEKQPHTKTRSMRTWWYSAAAVFIFAMIAYWWANRGIDYKEVYAGSTIVTDTLADGSVVHLNENTTLRISQNYGNKVRAVWLQGEGLFEVKKDTMPFYVYTQYARVEVMGTVFNVVSREKEPVELSVQEGQVRITSGRDETVQRVVKKGEKVVYYDKPKVIEVQDEEASNEVFWYSKTLVFERTPLLRVFKRLEEIYQVDIRLESEDLENCKLTGTYEMMTLENVLEIITSTFELDYQRDKDEIIIRGEGCP